MIQRKKTKTGTKRGGLALTLTLLLLAAALLLAACQNTGESEADPLTRLESSISYKDGEIRFTIPESGEAWSIQINGRILTDGNNGMSVHYLAEESESGAWESGKEYSFDVSGGGYAELYLDAGNSAGSISVDLLELLPESLKSLAE